MDLVHAWHIAKDNANDIDLMHMLDCEREHKTHTARLDCLQAIAPHVYDCVRTFEREHLSEYMRRDIDAYALWQDISDAMLAGDSAGAARSILGAGELRAFKQGRAHLLLSLLRTTVRCMLPVRRRPEHAAVIIKATRKLHADHPDIVLTEREYNELYPPVSTDCLG